MGMAANVQYHVLQDLSQASHIALMVVPDLPKSSQKNVFLRVLHTFILRPRREIWYDFLVSQKVQILDNEAFDTPVKGVSLLVEYHVVCVSMIFFKRQVCSVMILDLPYVF